MRYYKCHIQASFFVYIEEEVHDLMLKAGWVVTNRQIPCELIDAGDIPEHRRKKTGRTGRFNGVPTKAELKPMKEEDVGLDSQSDG